MYLEEREINASRGLAGFRDDLHPLCSNVEGRPHEFDGCVHIQLFSQVNAHPATVGKDVAGSSATRGNQLLTDFLREGNVHQTFTMDVANFSPPKGCSVPPKRCGWDVIPDQPCKTAFILSFAPETAIRPHDKTPNSRPTSTSSVHAARAGLMMNAYGSETGGRFGNARLCAARRCTGDR